MRGDVRDGGGASPTNKIFGGSMSVERDVTSRASVPSLSCRRSHTSTPGSIGTIALSLAPFSEAHLGHAVIVPAELAQPALGRRGSPRWRSATATGRASRRASAVQFDEARGEAASKTVREIADQMDGERRAFDQPAQARIAAESSGAAGSCASLRCRRLGQAMMAALPARQRRLGDAEELGRMALLDAAQAAPSAQRAAVLVHRPLASSAIGAAPEHARQAKVEDHDRQSTPDHRTSKPIGSLQA